MPTFEAAFAAAPSRCDACPVRDSSLWAHLGAREFRDLMGHRSEARFRPGQALFLEGHPCHGLHCVSEGLLALRKSDDAGNSVILRLVQPGETLGYPAFFGRMTYIASAEVLREARVCFFPVRSVQEILERSPSLRDGFLHLLAEELRGFGEARLRDATLPLARRLADLLLELLPTCGERPGDGRGARLTLPISRRDLAAMLGVRPETVARAVKQFGDAGLAEFDGREVAVPDLGRLKRAARGGRRRGPRPHSDRASVTPKRNPSPRDRAATASAREEPCATRPAAAAPSGCESSCPTLRAGWGS